MIRGYFSATHAARTQPYVPSHAPVPMLEARIWIPMRGNVRDPAASAMVPFLVDTGADLTVLHPRDASRLFPTPDDWNWVKQQPYTSLGGAGQGRAHYQVDAFIFLIHADATVDSHILTLYIAEPHSGNIEVESLLGRDVLANYQTCFDRNTALTLEAPNTGARASS